MGRCHMVLIPGFAGFDMLGQLEYYAGVTELRPRDAALHYFDNFPTATVTTRATRLQKYLIKRVLRGEFGTHDRIALIGHSTGGLDIRQLIWNLSQDALSESSSRCSFDGLETPKQRISSQLLRMIQRVVFLSVPQWGTNIANWVKSNDYLRPVVLGGLRAAVAGSQVPLLNCLEDYVTTFIADHEQPDILFAIRDALHEAEPVEGGKGESGAMAQEAASELCLWLRHMASDFSVIDDLTVWNRRHERERRPVSPAHFGSALRAQEQEYWHDRKIRTRSYATIGPVPEPAHSDLLYSLFYRACATGPFQYPGGHNIPQPKPFAGTRADPITVSDNDGIVNTASMLWPDENRTVLVECDHMDIVGHYEHVPTTNGAGRKYQAYDLLRSLSGFNRNTFTRVWNEVFDFADN